MARVVDLSGRRILLGVTGSIAAYKAADLASQLVGMNALVQVVLTEHAAQFVGPATFRALTGHTPLTGVFDEIQEGNVAHIAVVERADLLLIAPATANVIGKLASGLADDMLTTLAIAAQCPIVLAPAMNSAMWANPIVMGNVDRLRNMNFHIVEPVQGRLACGVTGPGKLAPVEQIISTILDLMAPQESVPQDLAGVNFLITAGPTREPIDPVRFLSNYSTGAMGYALAAEARRRGATVTLVSGPGEVEPPQVDRLLRVQTAAEMLEAVKSSYRKSHVIIGTAAVADFSPRKAGQKIKKGSGEVPTIELEETADILAEVGRDKEDRILVGFALETENLEQYARQKLQDKNLDLIVANSAGEGNEPFGTGPSTVRLITRDGGDHPWPLMSKQEIAQQLLTFIRDHFLSGSGAFASRQGEGGA